MALVGGSTDLCLSSRDYPPSSITAAFLGAQKAFEPRQTHDDGQQPDQYPQHPFGGLADHGAPSGVARQSKWIALRSSDPASPNRLRRGPGKTQARANSRSLPARSRYSVLARRNENECSSDMHP